MSPSKSGDTPQAPTTEASVLGACLVEGTIWWNHLSKLSEGDPVSLFHDSHHRMIAMAMDRATEGGGDITDSSIEDQLILLGVNEQFPISVADYLVQLQGGSSTMNLKSLASSVGTLAKKRTLRNQVTEIERVRQSIMQGEMLDPGTVSKELSAMSLKTVAAKEVRTMGELIGELEEVSEAPWYIPTGLKELDIAYGGGWEPGRSYVIAARPKVGKTTMMMSSIVAALDAGAVVIAISLETLERDFYIKMMSTVAQVDKSLVKNFLFGSPKDKGEVMESLTDEDIEEIEASRAFLRESKLFTVFSRELGQGFDSIPGILYNVKYKYPNTPIILFADYLQLFVENQGFAQQELAEYTRAFHLMAVEMSASMVYLSQLNRDGVEGEMPGVRNLRGSGSIEQDVDSAIMLNRKGLFDDNEPEHVLDVHVALNRSGPPRKFSAYFDGKNNTVSDLDDVWSEESEESDNTVRASRGDNKHRQPSSSDDLDDEFDFA